MLRRFVVLGATVALLAVLAGPVLGATSSFKAVIHEDFGRRTSARTCVVVAAGLRCDGDGPVQGYGTVLLPRPSTPRGALRAFGR